MQDFFFGIPNWINIFSQNKKDSFKNQIFMEEIKDIDMMESQISSLFLRYRYLGGIKEICLEFDNPTTSLYILAKIRYLM